jgi:hypothetical protein
MIAAWGISDWSAAIAVVSAIAMALFYVGRLYLRNGYATSDDLNETRNNLTALTRRTEQLEAQSSGMATRDDVNKVLLAIQRADGERSSLAAEISGVKDLLGAFQHQLTLIHQALLQGNGQ